MSIKRIVIILGSVFGVAILTLGILYFIDVASGNGGDNTKIDDTPKPIIFNEMSDIMVPPTLSIIPSDNSWVVDSSKGELDPSTVILTKNGSSCSLSIASRLMPRTDNSLADYNISKQQASTIASGEGGKLANESVVKIESSKGDVDFFVGQYNPTIRLVQSNPKDTKPSSSNKTEKVTVPVTILLAVRSIADSSQKTETMNQDDSDLKNGIVTLDATAPSIVARYECQSDSFNREDAINLIKKLKLNFSVDNVVKPDSSLGK